MVLLAVLIGAIGVALIASGLSLQQMFVYTFTGTGAGFTAQAATAAADTSITLAQADGNPIFMTAQNLLTAYTFGQTDLTDVLLVTPTLRIIEIPHLRPFDASTTPQDRPYLPNYRHRPLILPPNESISIQMSGSTGTLGAKYYTALWIDPAPAPATQGQMLTAHFTASITTVTNGWAAGTITFDQVLPSGLYTVVGMQVYGTNLAFARLIFPNVMPRPGSIAGTTAAYIECPAFRLGGMGNWGVFSNLAVPQLEVFATGSGTSQTGFMDLIKTG